MWESNPELVHSNTQKKLSYSNIIESTYVVRYADDFIITEKNLEYAIRGVKDYLKIRGLELREEKSKSIKWTKGQKKLDFLSWTFHLISPREVNWLTNVPNSVSTRLKDRTKLYLYPSRKATQG